jgi:hypothetical protein
VPSRLHRRSDNLSRATFDGPYAPGAFRRGDAEDASCRAMAQRQRPAAYGTATVLYGHELGLVPITTPSTLAPANLEDEDQDFVAHRRRFRPEAHGFRRVEPMMRALDMGRWLVAETQSAEDAESSPRSGGNSGKRPPSCTQGGAGHVSAGRDSWPKELQQLGERPVRAERQVKTVLVGRVKRATKQAILRLRDERRGPVGTSILRQRRASSARRRSAANGRHSIAT